MQVRLLIVGLLLTSSMAPLYAQSGDASSRSTDANKIKSFLTSPTTHVFPDSGMQWKSSTEYLAYGKKTGTTCEFSDKSTSASKVSRNVVSEELAVDRTNCISLIREGEPTQSSWDMFVEIIRKYTGKIIDSKKNSAATNRAVMANSQSTTPDTEDSAVQSLTFTDGNHPLMKLVGYNGIQVASSSAGVTYDYNKAYPVENGCQSQVSQMSIGGSTPQPGYSLLGWYVVSAGSCQVWNQFIGSWYPSLLAGYDASGQDSASGPIQLCQTMIPSGNGDCLVNGDFGVVPTSTLGQVAQAVYGNDSSHPPLFDCSGGLRIAIPYINVYMYPRSVMHYSWDYQVTGTDGPMYGCVSYIKAFTSRSETLGSPYN